VLQAGDLTQRIKVPAGVVGYVKQHDASNAGLHPGDWHSPHVETPTLILVRSGHLKQRRPAHA